MKVVGYCRFSSENQRDGYSIDAQKGAIEEYCSREGYTVVGFYIDEAKTGTSDERESFQQMISDSSSKRFQAVVVHKLDRFARDRYDSAVYKKKLKDNGVRLISVLEPLDDSPESIMMESVLEGMAEYFSKNLAREVRKGKIEAAKKALFQGGTPAYGYTVSEDKRLILREDEATVVREIFRLYDSGLSLADIARHLYDAGIKNRQGNWFSDGYIGSLLRNDVYKGVYRYGKRNKKREPIVVPDGAEKAVSVELFDRVQKRLKERSATGWRPKARNKGDTYILTGYLKCGICGSHMHGHKGAKNRKLKDGTVKRYYTISYKCANKYSRLKATGFREKCTLKSMTRNKIDPFVINSIEAVVFSEDNLKAIVDKVRDRIIERQRKEVDLSSIEREVENINKQIDRLLTLYLDGSLDMDTYKKKKDELESSLEYYKVKIKNATVIDPNSITYEMIRDGLAGFLQSEKADSIEYKKLLLSTFLDRVEMTNENIDIYFKLPIQGSTGAEGYVSCLRADAS